jgi:hypothetical protein
MKVRIREWWLRASLPLAILLALLLSPGEKGGLSAQAGNGPFASPADDSGSEASTTEGALTILLPVGARGISLGRAMTARRGSEAVFWNPAGIARMESGQFTVFRGDHLAGEATAFSLLLTRQPLGSVAVSYQLLDLGDQDLTDRQGNILGTVSFRDHLGIVSFATRALPTLDVGLNFKIFQSKVTCRGQCTDAGVSGRTFAIDAGLQSTPLATLPLRISAMIAHVGPDLQLINVAQADPLPTRLRLALAYEILETLIEIPDMELWISAEVEDRWQELGSPAFYLGGELQAGREDLFFLRAGYGRNQTGGSEGLAAGLGLRYERFELSIAKSLTGGSLGPNSEPVHVTFGVGF